LSHYSIKKAGKICNLEEEVITLDRLNWAISVDDLKSKIKILIKKGYSGFLLPLTLGYTLTGSDDDLKEVLKTVKKIIKENSGINFFIWIDAAFNGLIYPFLNRNFRPLGDKLIQGIVVDYHKMGMVPYSGGVVLYRKKNLEVVVEDIDYLAEKDATLLGSRSGAAAAGIWTVIQGLGKDGYRKMIEEQLENKRYFVEKFNKSEVKGRIVYVGNGLNCAISLEKVKNLELLKKMEEKYWLNLVETDLEFFPKKHFERLKVYRIYFLPHLKKKIVNEFIFDLERLFRS
jgi:glutamate/tyrosine decarboxylase-like PLP-dependent enzyme